MYICIYIYIYMYIYIYIPAQYLYINISIKKNVKSLLPTQSTIDWKKRNYYKILQDIFQPSLIQISTLSLWILLLYIHIKDELQKRDFLSASLIFLRYVPLKVTLKKKKNLSLNIYALHFKKPSLVLQIYN